MKENLLNNLKTGESERVLQELLSRHPELRAEAASLARDVVADVSVDEVRASVSACVLDVDLDDLNHRAGRHSWGYVEPSEAAWELLEDAVGDILQDMKRRQELGHVPAAEKLCKGIVLGLYDVRNSKEDGVLGWAPDFPAETAAQALLDFLALLPRSERVVTGQRILTNLREQAEDWAEMLERAIRGH